MMRSIVALVAVLSLSACLTDPYGTKPEVNIDPEKLEAVIAEREAAASEDEDDQ